MLHNKYLRQARQIRQPRQTKLHILPPRLPNENLPTIASSRTGSFGFPFHSSIAFENYVRESRSRIEISLRRRTINEHPRNGDTVFIR